ncbi:unnamed protein product [Allacma fusca]|uniref:Uncharacterized protein n=1 Tax=Allacma fusca TaxID=39272 RepID=A0A8J2PBS1_9HEXA|nr:unnamed protein product [Allacma fusca]
MVSYSTESRQLKYVWGDALDDPLANGPDGNPYPWDTAAKVASKQRNPKMFSMGMDPPDILSPKETREILLKAFQAQERGDYLHGMSLMSTSARRSKGNVGQHQTLINHRQGRVSSHFNESTNQSSSAALRQNSAKNKNSQNNAIHYHGSTNNEGSETTATIPEPPLEGCVPSRLCASTYNTTAPLYGVSLTSGQPVTIVQKFPDLLQQVVFQVCKTSECEVLQGECVQTYLPYLFLVIPLGPVTLTGQDYVLVESGCVCRPKYARRHDEPPPLPFIQPLNR